MSDCARHELRRDTRLSHHGELFVRSTQRWAGQRQVRSLIHVHLVVSCRIGFAGCRTVCLAVMSAVVDRRHEGRRQIQPLFGMQAHNEKNTRGANQDGAVVEKVTKLRRKMPKSEAI